MDHDAHHPYSWLWHDRWQNRWCSISSDWVCCSTIHALMWLRSNPVASSILGLLEAIIHIKDGLNYLKVLELVEGRSLVIRASLNLADVFAFVLNISSSNFLSMIDAYLFQRIQCRAQLRCFIAWQNVRDDALQAWRMTWLGWAPQQEPRQSAANTYPCIYVCEFYVYRIHQYCYSECTIYSMTIWGSLCPRNPWTIDDTRCIFDGCQPAIVKFQPQLFKT
jgi:hypothetical protein